MAALQNIRNHAGLLIGIVALALGAFVVGDALNSTSSILGRSRSIVGTVNGKELSITDFNEKERQSSEIRKQFYSGQDESRIRTEVWNEFVENSLVDSEMDEIGMTVTNDEIKDLVQSANHRILMDIPLFRDETGRFNPEIVKNFIGFISVPEESLDENRRSYQQQLKNQWMYWEDLIKARIAKEKLENLVSKAISYPAEFKKILSDVAANDKNALVIKKSYNTEDVQVSDADKNSTYEKIKKQYFTLENGGYRSLDALVFEVKPSNEDYENTKAEMEELRLQMKNADETYLKAIFSDPSSLFRYNDVYRAERDIEMPFQAFAFEAKKDSVSEVLFQNGHFLIAKKTDDVKLAPDSANISVIALMGSTKEEAKAKSDSIMKCLNNGEKFEDLASKHSLDQSTASKGGEIGWVKEEFQLGADDFASKVFGNSKKGDLLTFEMPDAPMSFIIKVNDLTAPVKKAKIAVYGHNLEPSSDTYTNTFNQANKFVVSNKTKDAFLAAAGNENLNLYKFQQLGKNDPNVSELGGNTREIVKWAWSHNVGDVSDVFEVGDSYIVCTLSSAVDSEFAPLSEDWVNNLVTKKAKTEVCAKKLSEELANVNDFSSADTINGVNFLMNGVSNYGYEPNLVAAISSLPTEGVSKVIVGENGVYKAKVLSQQPSEVKINDAALNQELKGLIQTQMIRSLRKKAEIEDNRSNFF